MESGRLIQWERAKKIEGRSEIVSRQRRAVKGSKKPDGTRNKI